jgi:hypothetical protein
MTDDLYTNHAQRGEMTVPNLAAEPAVAVMAHIASGCSPLTEEEISDVIAATLHASGYTVVATRGPEWEEMVTRGVAYDPDLPRGYVEGILRAALQTEGANRD